jgi:hypothetical protein
MQRVEHLNTPMTQTLLSIPENFAVLLPFIFSSPQFEEMFSKYGRTFPDAMTWDEVQMMADGNK